jgi:hypothetical protein
MVDSVRKTMDDISTNVNNSINSSSVDVDVDEQTINDLLTMLGLQ